MKKKFIFLMCWMLSFTLAFSQTNFVEIGTGTSSYQAPLPGWYGWNYDVALYTSAEIGESGEITHIAYNVQSAGAASGNKRMKIYMTTTSSAILNSTVIPSFNTLAATADLVYTSPDLASLNFTRGWFWIELDNPFYYDNSENLLIMVEGVGCNASGGCPSSVYGTATTSNQHWHKMQDSAPLTGDETNGTFTTANRANVRLSLDTNVTCLRVANLTVDNILIDNAEISWTTSGTESSWFVSYKENSSATWSDEETVYSMDYDFYNSLISNTQYNFRVRAYCGEGDTSGYAQISFWTECIPMGLPINENFDEAVLGTGTVPNAPNCWSYVRDNTSSYAYVSASSPNSSPNCYYLYNGSASSTQKTALISPMISTADHFSDLKIRFSAKAIDASYTLKVGYLTADRDISTFVLLETIPLTTSWAQYDVDFEGIDDSDHVTNIVFLHGQASANQSIYLDDILIDRMPGCDDVDMNNFIVLDAATQTSITIDSRNEDGDLLGYVFKYRAVGTMTWSNEENASTFPHTIEGLNSGTEYEIMAKKLCDEGASLWSSATSIGYTAFEVPIVENFDGTTIDKGWYYWKNNTAGSIYSSTIANEFYSSPRGIYLTNGTTATGHKLYYISPKIDQNESMTTLQVRFKARANVVNANVDVGIMNLDDINSYESVKSLPLTSQWGTYIVSFEGYTGSDAHRVAFGHLNNFSSTNIYLDDIHIELIENCPEVANIVYSNVSDQNITLTWRADGVNNYTIRYCEVGDTDTTDVAVSTNTHTLSALTPQTDYMVKVYNSCDPDAGIYYLFTTSMVPQSIPFLEDFEDTDHVFVFANGTQTNQWMVGTDAPAQPAGSTQSLYISNDGTTNSYNNASASNVFAYVTLNFAVEGTYAIEYDWKAYVEACCDYGQVWLAPVNGETYVAGTAPTSIGWTNLYGSNLNQVTAWQHKTIVFNITTPGLYNLVVYWRNDLSMGTPPPMAMDNFSIEKMDCNSLISLTTHATTHSANITFSAFSTTTDVRLYFRDATVTGLDSVDINLASLTDNTYTLSGLNSGTIYYISAKGICTGSESSVTTEQSFQTVCEAEQLPWIENFTSTTFPPTLCWTRASGLFTPNTTMYTDGLATNTSWTRTTVNSTNPAARINIYGSNVRYWLMSPLFSMEDGHNMQLSLDIMLGSSDGTTAPTVTDVADDKFIVLISTDGGVSWDPQNTVKWYSNATGDYRYDSLTNVYKTFNIPLAGYSGDIRIAFYGESTVYGGDNYLFIDNISISSCERPAELTVSDITASSATFSWIPVLDNTTFEYVLSESSDTPDGSDLTQTTSDSSINIDQLMADTTYYFHVRANCDGGDNSEWTSVSFTTPCWPFSQFPRHESFEDTSSMISCWRVINNNGDGDRWTRTLDTTYAQTGSYSYRMYTNYNGGANDDYLISPLFTLTGNEYLKFHVRARTTGEPNDIRVVVSTTGTAPSEFVHEVMPLTSFSTTTYQEFTVDLSAFTGNVYVAFHVPPGGLDGYYINLDNVSIEVHPDCVNPENIKVVNFDNGQGTLTWRIPGFAADVTGLELIYVECGEDITGETPVSIPGTDMSYTLTNLDFNTCYDIYLKSVCSNDTTNWMKIEYQTPCEAFTLPFFDDFEDNSPALTCWKVWDMNNDNDNWIRFTTNPFSGSHCYRIYTDYNNGNNDDWLISPPLQFTGNDYLSFVTRAQSTNEPNDYQVFFSTTGSNPADFTTQVFYESIALTTYQERVINLPSHTGVGYIAFRIPSGGLDGYYLYIDDVYVSPIPTCPIPENVTVSVINHESVEIYWNRDTAGTETTWEIAVDLAGFDISTYTGAITVTDSSWIITGLQSNTAYDVYVRAICDDPNDMWWSRKKSFTTDCDPLTYGDLPYAEPFDTYGSADYPTCWKRINTYSTTNTYPYISTTNNTTPGSLYFYCSSSATVMAISRPFDGSVAMSQLEVNFQLYANALTSGVVVGVMDDPRDNSTFTPVDTIFTTVVRAFENNFTVLTNYAGTGKYIALKYYGTTESSIYIDDFLVRIAPTCLPVSNVTAAYNETANTATISWEERGGASQWQIVYSEAIEFDPNDDLSGASFVVTNSNPHTITTLNLSSAYTFYVRAICTPGDTSRWSGDNAYILACAGAASVPYFEDFDGYNLPIASYNTLGVVPGCWEAFSNNTTYYPPHITNSGIYHYPSSGNQCLTFTSGNAGANSYAILPEFSDPLSTLTIAFKYRQELASYGTLHVGYVTDNTDPSTFVSLKQFPDTETITPDTAVMADYIIPAEATHLAFHWNHNTSYYSCSVDDISVTITPVPCAPPTNVTVSNVLSNSATVTWTAGGTESGWIVEHRKGDVAYSSQTVNQPVALLGNLDPNTRYDVRVKAVCGVDDESEYVATTFTTGEAEGSHTITPISSSGGEISPNYPVTVQAGETQLFTFTPDADYTLRAVYVDDSVSVSFETVSPNVYSYTFTDVRADHTIKGDFIFGDGIPSHLFDSGVELYPNPANSVVNVKTDVLFETLEVTNMLGQLIYSAPVTGNQFQINISGYNAGVYFIKLSGSAGSAVKKVVKN